MRNLLLCVIALLCQYNISTAQINGGVNECTELTNIVFRLAEIREYLDNDAENYSQDIDRYFANYKSHQLIQFVQNLNKENSASYEMLPKVIACLEAKNGRVVLRDGVEIDKSQQEDFIRFITLLNNFYKKTNFRHFYNKEVQYYDIVNERFQALLCEINTHWFKSLFDQEFGNPIIVVSPSNGRYNYAIPDLPDKNHNMMIIIGNSQFDKDGFPIYNDMTLFSIVHELMHRYTNVRMKQMWEQFKPASSTLYSHVQNSMHAIGYNDPQTMAIEWLNNLFTLLYLKNNGQQDSVDFLIRILEGNGFIWMDRSLKFMEHYYENQDIFPNIDAFMFQLVGFIETVSNNIDQIKQEVINKRPYIVDTFPVIGGTVSDNINEIIFRFSVPMMCNAYGVGASQNDLVTNLYPIIKDAGWTDEYTFVLALDSNTLKKGVKYGIVLSQYSFQSTKFYSLSSDYIYEFKTAE